MGISNRKTKKLRRRTRVGGTETKGKRKRGEEETNMFFTFVRGDNQQMAEEMLRLGEVPNVDVYDKSEHTALFWSAAYGYKEMTRLLLSYGANPDKSGSEHLQDIIPPISIAVQNNYPEVIKLLIDAGADLNITSRKLRGATPLIVAIYTGHIDNMKMLITAGASVTLSDATDVTPLHWAAWMGITNAIQPLIDAGAEVDAEDDVGETPLYKAANEGHNTIVRLLIDAGANVDLDNNGKSAIYIASMRGRHEIVAMLIKAGAMDFEHYELNDMISEEMEEYSEDSEKYQDLLLTSFILNASEMYMHIPSQALSSYSKPLPMNILCNNIFDPITMEEKTIDSIFKTKDDILCLFNDKPFILSRKELEGEMETNIDKLLYECKESNLHFQQNESNIVTGSTGEKVLYFNMAGFGIMGVMVPVSSLKEVVKDVKIFVIDTSKDSVASRPVTSLGPFLGGNVVGARHCQENDPLKIGRVLVVSGSMLEENKREKCTIQGGRRGRRGRSVGYRIRKQTRRGGMGTKKKTISSRRSRRRPTRTK